MTIEINDLPELRDLTPEQLKELFGAGRFRPTFEQLEDRLVQSGVSATAYLGSTATAYSPNATSAYTQLAPAPAATAVVAVTPTQPASLSLVGANDAYAGAFATEADLANQAALYLPAAGLDLTSQVAPAGSTAAPAAYGQVSQPAMNFLGGQTQEQGRIAIENKAAEFAAVLGRPLGNWGNTSGASEPTADGIGRMQAFENGSIFWSPVTGAHVVRRDILNGYAREGGAAYLGYPSTDTDYVAGWGTAATFNNFFNNETAKTTTIVYTDGINGRDAFVVSGPIREWWAQHGFGSYGLPVGQQYAIGGNVRPAVAQDFVVKSAGGGRNFATIVSSPTTGTHDVVGLIKSRWERDGRPGLPTTDHTGIDSSRNLFTRQVVHFNRPGGEYFAIGAAKGRDAYYVVGYVYLAWHSSGGEAYGVPISPERSVVSDGRTFQYSKFLHRDGTVRTIYWTPSRAPQFGVTALAEISGVGPSHYYENLDDDKGVHIMDFTPRAGPTGLEPVTRTATAPLKVDGPNFDATAVYHDTDMNQAGLAAIYGSLLPSAAYGQSVPTAQAGAIYSNLLNPTDAYQDTYEAAPNISWADYTNLPFSGSGSELLPWDPNDAYIDDPVNPDSGDASEDSAGQEAPPALNSGDTTPTIDQLGADLENIGSALLAAQRNELQARLDDIGLSLQQAQQGLQTALDVQVQSATENERSHGDVQSATLALNIAEQSLATRSAAVAKAEAAFNQANQSTRAFQAQTAKRADLQTRVAQATVIHQQALKAQKANRNSKLNAPLQQAVNKAKANLDALSKQLNAQITVVQSADKKMKVDAPALKKATAALELVRGELAASTLVRDQAALSLTNLQAVQVQVATALAQAQQQLADAQGHIDQLAVEQAGAQNALEALQVVPAFAGAAATVSASQPDVAAVAAQLVSNLGLGSYRPEWTADNWLGRGERWILSNSNEWYFITPDGGLFRYSGSKTAASALVGALDQSYWQDLSKLLSATAQSASTAATATVQNQTSISQPDVAAVAARLVGELGLGSYRPEWTADNWLGRGERWILSHANEWYFITPDGGLFRYGGSKTADSALVGTLNHSYWDNLDKLLSAT